MEKIIVIYNDYILLRNYSVYFRKVIIIAGWLLLAFLAYKVSQFDYESASFDPYDILNVPIVSIYYTIYFLTNYYYYYYYNLGN